MNQIVNNSNDIIEEGFHIETMPDILTPEMVKEYLHLGRSKTYVLMGQPNFPAFRIGKEIRVKKGDLLKWIDEQKLEGKN